MNDQLMLHASESNWRLFMIRRADPAFATFSAKVFERDHDTCRYCGFRHSFLQEVVNLNGNYHDNRIDNLITACPFCMQCHFMESIGQFEGGGGTLIPYNELSQSAFNAMIHYLFFSMSYGGAREAKAKNIYRGLRMRSKLTEKQFGEGMSDPSVMGRSLIDSNVNVREHFKKNGWNQLRLMPVFSHYVFYLHAWVRNTFKDL